MTDILCLEKNDLNNKSLNTYIEMADIDEKNDNTDCVSKNELINEMFKDGHALLNTKPYDKIPVAKWGGVYVKKIRIHFEAFNSHYEENQTGNGYAIRLGYNEDNKRYMISLDFDIKNTNKSRDNERCAELYQDFRNLEIDDGRFNSSTEGNYGCLVDITKSSRIKRALENYGNKIVKFGGEKSSMEVLCGGIVLLPPSQTQDKIKKKKGEKRRFINDKYCYVINEPGNDEFEDWFIENLPKPNKTKSKTKDNYTTENAIKNIQNKSITDKNSLGLMNKFTNPDALGFLLDSDTISAFKYPNNGGWWRIIYCIINILGEGGEDLAIQWSDCDNYPREDYEEANRAKYKEFMEFMKTAEYTKMFNEYYLLKVIKNKDEQEYYKLAPMVLDEHKRTKYIQKKDEFELEHGWAAIKKCEKNSFTYRCSVDGQMVFSSSETLEHHFHSYDIKEFFKKWIDDPERAEWDEIISNPYQLIKNPVCGEHRHPNKYDETKGLTKKEWKQYNVFSNTLKLHIKLKDHEPTEQYEQRVKDFCELYLLKRLCDGHKPSCDFIIQWLAWFLFHRKPNICPVFTGKQGGGKTSLAVLIRKIIGLKHCHSSSNPKDDIFARFNKELLDKMFGLIEEPSWDEFKNQMGKFKDLITKTDLQRCEGKNESVFFYEPHITFMIASNNIRLFQNEEGQRRFMFYHTFWEKPSKEKNAFWKNFYDNLDDESWILDIMYWIKSQLNEDYNFEEKIYECASAFHKSQDSLYKNCSTNRFVKWLLTEHEWTVYNKKVSAPKFKLLDVSDEAKSNIFQVCLKYPDKRMEGDDKYYIDVDTKTFKNMFKKYSGNKLRDTGLEHDFETLCGFKPIHRPTNRDENGNVIKERPFCYKVHPYYLKKKLEALNEWDCDLDWNESDFDADNPDGLKTYNTVDHYRKVAL